LRDKNTIVATLLARQQEVGRKTIILSVPARSVLNALERVGPDVVPGDDSGW